MGKKVNVKQNVEEDNVSDIVNSDGQNSTLLRKKPWTDEEDLLVKKLV